MVHHGARYFQSVVCLHQISPIADLRSIFYLPDLHFCSTYFRFVAEIAESVFRLSNGWAEQVIMVRFPAREEIFLFFKTPGLDLVPTQPASCPVGAGFVCPRRITTGTWGCPLRPIKTLWRWTFILPSVLEAWCSVQHEVNLTVCSALPNVARFHFY